MRNLINLVEAANYPPSPGTLFSMDGETVVGYWYKPRTGDYHVIAWDAADNINQHSDHCDVVRDHPEWFDLTKDIHEQDCDTIRDIVVNKGWVRVGYNSLIGRWVHSRNPKEAFVSTKWFLSHHDVSLPVIDISIGNNTYTIKGSAVDEYLTSGRLEPACKV